jgi:hypothetical protein
MPKSVAKSDTYFERRVDVRKKEHGWHPARVRARPSFSTIQICQFFDISKATLYRWEREGLISMPSRDWRNWRLYSTANIAQIKSLIRRRMSQ